jgi:hypothetical protein
MSNLTMYLQSIGCRQTVYPTSVGRVRTNATWSPSIQWNGTDTQDTFYGRYGFYNEAVKNNESPQNQDLYSAGDYVGEALPSGVLGLDIGILQTIRQVVGDPSFSPDQQDLMDLRVVRDPNLDDPVYNTRFKPLLEARNASS